MRYVVGIDNRFSGRAFRLACELYWEALPLFVSKGWWPRFDVRDRAMFLSITTYSATGGVYILQELVEMSRKKVGMKNELQGASDSKGEGEFSWLNISLSPEDVSEALSLCESPADVASEFVGLISFGLSITLKATSQSEVMAACFGLYPNGARFGLSCWGGTPTEAVAGLLVKFHVGLGGALPDTPDQLPKPRIR